MKSKIGQAYSRIDGKSEQKKKGKKKEVGNNIIRIALANSHRQSL